jgi:hypothetical protein
MVCDIFWDTRIIYELLDPEEEDTTILRNVRNSVSNCIT